MQIASRMATGFSKWKRFNEHRQNLQKVILAPSLFHPFYFVDLTLKFCPKKRWKNTIDMKWMDHIRVINSN
jgi:hypothetical protein